MIDLNDSDIVVALFAHAQKLAALDDRRLEHELRTIQERAAAAFVAAGSDELTAFFAADSIVQRLHGLIANRRRAQAGGGRKM